MGRSVSVARGALLVTFTRWYDPSEEYVADLRADNDEDEDWYPEPDQDDWDWFVEDLQESVCSLWPSFTKCDEWVGREDHAVMENGLGYIGISEYCGLASIWFAPKPNSYEYSDTHNREDLARGFAARIGKKFHASFGTLELMGRFSNGEAIYRGKEEKAAA